MAEETNPQPEDDEPKALAEGSEEDESKTPLEQFIFHQRRGLEEFGKAMESLLPPGFKTHTQKAGIEFATGFRVLIDAAIDEIKKASEMEDPDSDAEADDAEQAGEDRAEDEDDDGKGSGKIRVELDD